MRIPKTPLDRAMAFIACILDGERDNFIAGMIELIVIMSEQYGGTSPMTIAEILRDAADRIEHGHDETLSLEARN